MEEEEWFLSVTTVIVFLKGEGEKETRKLHYEIPDITVNSWIGPCWCSLWDLCVFTVRIFRDLAICKLIEMQ